MAQGLIMWRDEHAGLEHVRRVTTRNVPRLLQAFRCSCECCKPSWFKLGKKNGDYRYKAEYQNQWPILRDWE